MELIFEKEWGMDAHCFRPAMYLLQRFRPGRPEKRLLDFRRWLKLISPDIIQN